MPGGRLASVAVRASQRGIASRSTRAPLVSITPSGGGAGVPWGRAYGQGSDLSTVGGCVGAAGAEATVVARQGMPASVAGCGLTHKSAPTSCEAGALLYTVTCLVAMHRSGSRSTGGPVCPALTQTQVPVIGVTR